MEEQMEGEAGAELKDDLAQRITATFRRTLPALRMSGKWIRGNLRYLSQAQVQAERPGQLHSAEEPPVANDAESRGGKGKGREIQIDLSQPLTTASSSKSAVEVLEIEWSSVAWVTLRDQVISPLLQGALW